MSANDKQMLNSNGRPQRIGPTVMIGSHELLGKNQRVIIKHRGENYCLRVTRQDKLILTK